MTKSKERVLGVDYVTLGGATVKDDKFMHLGVLGRGTICGRSIESFLVTYADVDVTCSRCVKKLVLGESWEDSVGV